jgi:hypothetical protein
MRRIPVPGYLKLQLLTPSALIIRLSAGLDLITAVSKLAALFSAPKSLSQ